MGSTERVRIGIYCEVAHEENPTGIGIHVRELLKALAEVDKENEYLLYHQQDVMALSTRGGLQRAPGLNFRMRPIRFPAAWIGNYPRIWWDYYLPHVLIRDRVDLFHGPNHFLPNFDRSRSIVTIHDLAYFQTEEKRAGETAMLREWTRRALDRAAVVIALSENTRRDVEALGVQTERVRVIYGSGHVTPESMIQDFRMEEVRRAFRLPKRFILFVGTLMARKNVPYLLRAYAEFKRSDNLAHGLVLAGQRGDSVEEIHRVVEELGLTSDVVITGYVADWQLPLLYKMADLFVFPTRYEGFGQVLIEAMSYGVPVIATDSSCLRESVGDAAELVPVDDISSLSQAMKSVLSDSERRRLMIERGRTRARLFSWHRCAQETLSLYREVAQRASEGNLARPVSVS